MLNKQYENPSSIGAQQTPSFLAQQKSPLVALSVQVL